MPEEKKDTLEWIYKAVVTTLLGATLAGVGSIWSRQLQDTAFQAKLTTQVDFIIEHISTQDQSIKDISDRLHKLESRIELLEDGTSRRK